MGEENAMTQGMADLRLVATTDDLPGREVTRCLGLVTASRTLMNGADIATVTEQLAARLLTLAAERGGQGVVGFRVQALGFGAVMAMGTAVRVFGGTRLSGGQGETGLG